MATVINNPDSGSGDNSGGFGMIVGAIVLILILIIFFVYGLPAIRNGGSNSEGTTVNVPDEIQVDVNSGGSAQ